MVGILPCGGRLECALNFLSFPLCFSLQHPGVPMTPHIFLSHIFLPLGHDWNPVLFVQSNSWYVLEMRIFPSKHGMEVDLTIWWVSFVWQSVTPPPLPLKNLSYVLAFLPHVVYSCLCKGSEKGPFQVKESFRQFSCLFIKVSYFVPTSDRHGIMATQDKYQPRMESESWKFSTLWFQHRIIRMCFKTEVWLHKTKQISTLERKQKLAMILNILVSINWKKVEPNVIVLIWSPL